MSPLSRIIDDASRSLAPVRGPRPADERAPGRQEEARRIGGEPRTTSRPRFVEADVEIIEASGARSRPVLSAPSSAFFAQHLGQHPEARNLRLDLVQAEVAYRDALDLGVALHRPQPLALAI